MGGALLSGGHQSSSPFIVGFAGFILAQEGLRLAHVSSRIKGSSRLQTLALLYIGRVNSFFFSRAPPESSGESENTVTFPRSRNYRKPKYLF